LQYWSSRAPSNLRLKPMAFSTCGSIRETGRRGYAPVV
jgi:hypothetical protein